MSRHNIDCGFIAKSSGQMQRDFNFTIARDYKDLLHTQELAVQAAQKAIDKLSPKKIKTTTCAVILAPRVANKFWSIFIAAITGNNLCRENTFLLNALGKKIFPNYINLTEEPHIKKGIASSPFDDEGVATKRKDVIKDGVLTNYILDSYSARTLSLTTTANAGGVYNIKVQPTLSGLDNLLKLMEKGLLITEIIGNGINIVTGEFSFGAFGFFVNGGTIQYPVEEITIAGNMVDFFRNIIAISDDFNNKTTISSGSVLVKKIAVGGI